MTDEELDTLVKSLDNLFAMLEEEGYYTKANTADFARKAITSLRAQLTEVKCVRDMMGRLWEKEKSRADRAEAERAAQIEVDAGICAALYRMALKDSDDDLSSHWKSHKASAYGTALQAIRAQPHDRTALDRMLAEYEVRLREAREKALREAAELCSSIRQRIANGPMPEGARFDYEQSILAMIDGKPDCASIKMEPLE